MNTDTPINTPVPTVAETPTNTPFNPPVDTPIQTPTNTVDPGLPPDPVDVAPPVDQSVVTTMQAATEFLYTGASPIQTGVAAGTIDAQRAAVLRGKVMDRSGAPIPAVQITVLGHPEFGQTLTRADGMFDLAVNGGGPVTVGYRTAGFLPAQRQVNAPWQDYAVLPDVVLIQQDPLVTTVDLAPGAPMQVARSSAVTDTDGARQATVLFPPGTTAGLVQPDGSTQPVNRLSVRLSEYTVGPNGPQTMPAELPPTSGYTYAVELGVDESVAKVNGRDVLFSQPVLFYVENFLNFPIGITSPMGYYDSTEGTWVPSASGRVIQIVGITGGLADLDTDGDGAADGAAALAALGITDPERQQLAALYPGGQGLWRVPVPHFSTWDINWGFSPPPDAVAPDQDPTASEPFDCQNVTAGSIIGCQNQTLGEVLGVVGTPFGLHYQSERVPGSRAAHSVVEIPLSGPMLPFSVGRIDLEITIAGRLFRESFPVLPNLQTTFAWDGKDAYGRTLQGRQPVTVRIGYTYAGIYQQTSSFGYNGGGSISGSKARREVTLWRTWRDKIGGWDARAAGLGGWTLSAHHTYDPAIQALYRGDGGRQEGTFLGPIITTAAGTGTGNSPSSCFSGDGGPATQAAVCPRGLAVAPDGSLYIADATAARVRRVAPSGIITTAAGGGAGGCSPTATCGDGGTATQATLSSPLSAAVGPDGSLYIGDGVGNRVRRVGPDGIITTVAGNGTLCPSPTDSCGDGGPATLAKLRPESVAVGPDGSLYIGDPTTRRLRRVGLDGIIATVAGTGANCPSATDACGDGGPATLARLSNPHSLAAGRDGSLYIADPNLNRVRRVTPDGTIRTIAGTGVAGFSGDGGPATQATFRITEAVAVGPDDSVYILDRNNHRVRWLRPDGTINTLAGNGATLTSGDGGPAAQAGLQDLQYGIAVAPGGDVYLSQLANNPRVRQISLGTGLLAFNAILAAAEEGSEVYLFDRRGRHLQTLDALTGGLLYQFAYDGAGRLASVTDGDGNVTTIERDATGNPTAIVGPFGQRTTLTTNTNGYIDRITSPTGEAMQFAYTADGLLTGMTNPRGHTTQYGFDPLGRLISATDPTGATKTLARTGTNKDYTVTLTSPLGRVTTYRIERLATGDVRSTTTDPAGAQTQVLLGQNGTQVATYPDGTTENVVLGPDPRWRMQAPVATSQTVRTPGGKVHTTTSQRTVTLATPGDLLSLSTAAETTTINGRVFTTAYDAATGTLTHTSATGRLATTIVDAQGRPVRAQLGGLAPNTLSYDLRGRLATATVGSGVDSRTTTFAYGGNGFLQSLTDPADQTASYTRDANGRVTELTLPDGAQSHFAYDANGNLTTLTPPARPDHLFAYTQNNQPSQYTAPIVGTQNSQTLTSYDADRLAALVGRPDGQSLGFQYDTAGRLSLLDLAVGDTQYGYDTPGRLVTVNRAQGVALSFTYDGGLPLGTTWSGAIAGSVSRAYDNDFRVTSLSVNGANPIALAYDPDGLLVQVGALTLTRNPQNGLVTATALGSVADATTYDSFAAPATYTVSQGGNVLYSTTYTRDALGRIASMSETLGGITHAFAYTYDLAGRLAEVRRDGTLTVSYTYDPNGNRLSRTVGSTTMTATYDAQDRLEQFGATIYAHNAAGERESQTTAGETMSYRYDSLGNLTGVTLPDATQIEYVLDGRERRVGKKVNGALVQGFLYQDGLKPIAELDGTSTIVNRFVYSDSDIKVPDYVIKAGVTYRIVADHVGSVRLVINAATGDIVQRLDYDEFGRVAHDTNPGFQPFGFAGGLYDADTQLVRFGARDYDAETGRWTTKDPILFAGGDSNLYAYVLGDPVNLVDPTGRGPLKPTTKKLGYYGGQSSPSAKTWYIPDESAYAPKPAPAPQTPLPAGERGLIAREPIPRPEHRLPPGGGTTITKPSILSRAASCLGRFFGRVGNYAGPVGLFLESLEEPDPIFLQVMRDIPPTEPELRRVWYEELSRTGGIF